MDDRPPLRDLRDEPANARLAHACGCSPYCCPQCNPRRNYEDVAFAISVRRTAEVVSLADMREFRRRIGLK